MNRQFLVTKFACSKCGNVLSLSYKEANPLSTYVAGEPTGIDMVQDIISIDPCETCTKPSRDAADAIKTLLRVSGGDK